MYKIRLTLIAFIALCGFTACQKENLPNSDGTRLQMTVSKCRDSLSYSTFKYDSQNRLTAIIDSSNNGFKHRLFIDYDMQGKLLEVMESHNATFDGSFAENSFSFIYDDKGRIIKKLSPMSTTGSLVRNTYSYDAKNRLIADSIYDYWTDNIFSYITYSYDENDNMIERKEFDKGSGFLKNYEQISYDNKPNPFKSQGLVFYFVTGSDFSLNTNNRILTEYEDGTIVTYDYEYYNNGMPKRVSQKDNTDPSITYFDFSYE